VFNGTANNDRMWASEGDDTLRGNDGNDWLQGGDGNDNHIGGLGNDIMQDLAGDDVLKGGDGNDAISSGQGFGGDLNQGGRDKDFIVGGNDITETFGGPGDDFVFAGDAEDTVFGDDGDDWIEGGKGPFNFLNGDNGAPFADDLNEPGHDVLMSFGGEQDYDSEGGDDIMFMGGGIQRSEGHMGFDWGIHKDDPLPADSDMAFTGLLPESLDNNRDRFDLVESLSGWNRNDTLRGDDATAADRGPEHTLNAEGVTRITGLGALVTAPYNAGNIILGGAGLDLIEGRGGDDIIDADNWLNVRLSVRNSAGTEIGSAESMGKPYLAGSTTTLQQAVFAGTVDPGNIFIVRELRTPTGAVLGANANLARVNDCPARGSLTDPTDLTVHPVAGTTNCDTTVFSLPSPNFQLQFNAAGPGSIRVVDLASAADPTVGDGTDTLWNVENLRFCTSVDPATGACIGARDVVIPNAPTLTSVTGGNASAVVNFTAGAANGSTVSGFRIQAFRADGTVAATATTGPGATSGTVTGLTNGQTYTFKVTALDAGVVELNGAADPDVESPPSNTSVPVTPAVPPAPSVIASTPSNGSTGIDNTGNIVVTFDQAILATSITGQTVVLTINGQTATINRTATLSADGKTLTVDPTPTLALNTTYRLALNGTVAGAPNQGLRNAAGLRVVNTAVSFTTRTPTAPTVVSSAPANGATGFAVGGNIAVTFNEPVTGVAATTVVLTVNGSTANLGRTVTTAGNTLTIDPNANLLPGTTYRVSLNGTVAGSTAGLRNADGVRLVNTSFTFTTTADTTAPTVIATSPLAGATGVARTPGVRIDTSERVQGVTTGAGGTYEIRNNATNALVTATLVANAAGTRWTLTPTAPLTALTTYRVTVTGGAAAVRDIAGNPLTTVTWTFTTR
jgi:Ca2+-binding RTX toxin-like protein/methionine-rich copper-binding protein CopC